MREAAVDRPYIKCIVVLSTLDRLPAPFPQPERYCRDRPVSADDLARLICLPLTSWSEDDIERWLHRYGDMGARPTATALRERVHTLYVRCSNGVPTQVLLALQDWVES